MTTRKAPAQIYVIKFKGQLYGNTGEWFMRNILATGELSDRYWDGVVDVAEATVLTLSDARLVRDMYCGFYKKDPANFTIQKVSN